MLAVNPQIAIFIAVAHVDFRLGIDGLAQCCRSILDADPMSGAVFVFRNRRGTAIKVLTYDGQGFWLHHKRWSSGKLQWWPSPGATSQKIPARELHILLHNGIPDNANMASDWRQLR